MATKRYRRLAVIAVAPMLLLFACSDDRSEGPSASSDDWGPLAVVTGTPNTHDAGVSGPLVVTDDCVTIRPNPSGESALLIWAAEGTSWDSESRTIEYDDGQGVVHLSDGDEVAFSGSPGFPDNREWVAEPDASCSTDHQWFVGGVDEHEAMEP